MDLLRASALEQAELLRRREISSVELTRLYLGRIRAIDGKIGAFVTVSEKHALRAAEEADRILAHTTAETATRTPFLGVPTAIKDLHPTREEWTHFGSRAFLVPPLFDCPTAKSLRGGGFVFVGKTAASEFGALPVTEPDGRPPTRNPWNLDFTAGGSSGGAAAAVAAGLLPIAHGSDGGGSVRIPSSVCHLFGFKPSRWLLPNAYGKADPNVLYTCGAIARTVSDAAAMIDVMMKSSAQHALRFHPGALLPQLQDAAPRGLRIRMLLNNPLAEPTPAIVAATRRVAQILAELGHQVEEATFPGAALEDFIPIWGRVVGEMPAIFPWRMQSTTKWLRAEGKRVSNADISRMELHLTTMVRNVLDGADILLSPTLSLAPLRVGALHDLSGKDAFHKAAPMGAFTAPYNLTGQPAATVPAGLFEGLPIGVQLAAAHQKDALVLQVCKELEEALPWANLWSPISGLRSSS